MEPHLHYFLSKRESCSLCLAISAADTFWLLSKNLKISRQAQQRRILFSRAENFSSRTSLISGTNHLTTLQIIFLYNHLPLILALDTNYQLDQQKSEQNSPTDILSVSLLKDKRLSMSPV